MSIDKLSKDQVSTITSSLDADVEELLRRGLSGLRMPFCDLMPPTSNVGQMFICSLCRCCYRHWL